MEAALRKRERWCYATREVERWPYEIDAYADEARTDVPDYALVAHAGHGVNSYAIHYFLVRGPLGLFVQAPWGGVYTAEDEAVATMREYFDLAKTLVRAAGDGLSPGRASDRLVVYVSDFYGSWWTPGVALQPGEPSRGQGRDVLRDALEWVRRRR
jgi:hypothetical protein